MGADTNALGVCTVAYHDEKVLTMKQLEERQTNVEGEIAGMKENMVTKSRVESMMAKMMAEVRVIYT